MLMWYKMMHKFSYEHNIEYNRSKIRALHPKIIGKNLSIKSNNYTNLVIKTIKIICKLWQIAAVMGIILSLIGKFYEPALLKSIANS